MRSSVGTNATGTTPTGRETPDRRPTTGERPFGIRTITPGDGPGPPGNPIENHLVVGRGCAPGTRCARSIVLAETAPSARQRGPHRPTGPSLTMGTGEPVTPSPAPPRVGPGPARIGQRHPVVRTLVIERGPRKPTRSGLLPVLSPLHHCLLPPVSDSLPTPSTCSGRGSIAPSKTFAFTLAPPATRSPGGLTRRP